MARNKQSGRSLGGVVGFLLLIIVAAAAAWFAYHHYHRLAKLVPSQYSSNTTQDFNAPPVPGTEKIRAQPLFDSTLAHHLDSGPSATPGTISPTNMKTAYTIPTSPAGAGTIAIVDAYDDPAAEQDLGTFSSNYSLPACTTANGCFEKHKMAPGLPVDTGWVEETSLDVQWAHAIAPNA